MPGIDITVKDNVFPNKPKNQKNNDKKETANDSNSLGKEHTLNLQEIRWKITFYILMN